MWVSSTEGKKENPPLAWRCGGLNFDKLEMFELKLLALEALLRRCDL